MKKVEKHSLSNKLFSPFPVKINCSNDLKNLANCWPLASNFKSFSRSLEHFFLTVGQNNFGNKIPFMPGHAEKKLRKCFDFQDFAIDG